jgi:sodium/potassium-transporting ATPase subunit alpha
LRGPNFNYEYDLQSLGFKNLHENAILSSEAVFDNAVPAAEVERISKLANATEREEEMNRAIRENEARIRVMNISERPVIGDASESAIVRFFQPIEDIISTRGRYPIVKMEDGSFGRIPFNSAWKFALAICEYKTADSDYCVFMKGAPEKIWAISTRVLVDGSEEQIDCYWRKKFDEMNLVFGEGGERVLGFAKFHLPREKFPLGFQFNCKNPLETNFPMKEYTFTGLVSLIDPPREAVPYAILKCRAAGIKVIMVTGDQPVTAAAIAKQVNIFGKNERTVNQVMESERISLDEALHKADALVIHGDLITKAVAEDELLPESNFVILKLIIC